MKCRVLTRQLFWASSGPWAPHRGQVVPAARRDNGRRDSFRVGLRRKQRLGRGSVKHPGPQTKRDHLEPAVEQSRLRFVGCVGHGPEQRLGHGRWRHDPEAQSVAAPQDPQAAGRVFWHPARRSAATPHATIPFFLSRVRALAKPERGDVWLPRPQHVRSPSAQLLLRRSRSSSSSRRKFGRSHVSPW